MYRPAQNHRMILALTGHRSERIEDVQRVRQVVRETLREAQPDAVVCGMANGFDLIAGHEAINHGFNVWAAKPWKTHKARRDDIPLYDAIIMFAEKIIDVVDSDQYPGAWVYQKRNEWMVDASTHVLAYFDGFEQGGTWNCIKYARKSKTPIRNIYAACQTL